jgi:hypothetical protein
MSRCFALAALVIVLIVPSAPLCAAQSFWDGPAVPDGGTVVIGGFKFLSDVPFFSRLFTCPETCVAGEYRTPIIGPLAECPKEACDGPSDAEVLHALGHDKSGNTWIYRESRDDIQIVSERVTDNVDEPRFFPLVGMARLHHSHWKCTVYFTQTIESDYPIQTVASRQCVEVVYIDKDHLHLCEKTETPPAIDDLMLPYWFE